MCHLFRHQIHKAPEAYNTMAIFLRYISGDGTVLWKQGERVISAGSIQVRKDYRLTLVEANSLRITDVDVTDTGILSLTASF